jgi:hypothetical protein
MAVRKSSGNSAIESKTVRLISSRNTSVESGDLRGLRSGDLQKQGVGGLRESTGGSSGVLRCALRGLRPSPVRGPRGLHRENRRGRSSPASALHDLPSPSKRPHTGRAPRDHTDRAPKRRPGAEAHPLLGFATCLPLHRHHPSASTSQRPELPRDTFGPTAPPVQLPFRPRGFAPPRRFSPRQGSRVCCAPLPVMRFAAFH